MSLLRTATELLASVRMRYISVWGRYRRGEKSWRILVSPGKPKMETLDCNRQVDASLAAEQSTGTTP